MSPSGFSMRGLSSANLIRHPERDLVFPHGRALPGSVGGGHRAQHLVAAPVVVLAVEEEGPDRLVGVRVVEHDDLLRRYVGRAFAALHLALHLGNSFAADTV